MICVVFFRHYDNTIHCPLTETLGAFNIFITVQHTVWIVKFCAANYPPGKIAPLDCKIAPLNSKIAPLNSKIAPLTLKQKGLFWHSGELFCNPGELFCQGAILLHRT